MLNLFLKYMYPKRDTSKDLLSIKIMSSLMNFILKEYHTLKT